MNYWNTVLAVTAVLSVVLYITTHNDNVGASIFSAAMFGFLLSAIFTGIAYVEYRLLDPGMLSGKIIAVLILAIIFHIFYTAALVAASWSLNIEEPPLMVIVIASVVSGIVGVLFLQAIRWGYHKTGITILS